MNQADTLAIHGIALAALSGTPTTAKLVPVERLLLAFVDGAKWWEFETSGGTMWQADQHRAFSEAELRSSAGTLGITIDELVKRAAALREEIVPPKPTPAS